MSSQPNDDNATHEHARASVLHFLKISLLVVGLAIGGFAIAAVYYGEDTNLAFDYEGFD